ncbi:hypothetical protein SAMN06265360_114147 [Haloechinothrix alba]|uniref:Uncharacterized protein n=1 Tax=Haloechinothrix alba TaxID=664784 RepID=A0A238YCS0_9PSEU|nr:hypothetical protein SAMN06265360_114147 [Haloechinothrix alba]
MHGCAPGSGHAPVIRGCSARRPLIRVALARPEHSVANGRLVAVVPGG